MRALLAAAVLGATALGTVPAHASADGCVTQLLHSGSPGLGGTVTVNPDGSVTVSPVPAENFARSTAGTAVAFVNCVV
jgi:hypothetical protein